MSPQIKNTPLSDKSSIIWGLEVPHQDANSMKNFLLQNNYLDNTFRINHTAETTIFPLKEPLSSPLVKTLPAAYILAKYAFVPRQTNKRSPTYQMKLLLPVAVHKYLPTSYDTVGDVLLVKLAEEILSYKTLIANSYLACLPNISAVYTKIAEITSPYRVAQWECIGGTPHTFTIHKMNGIALQVDFTKVYFNPRLSNEYRHVADACNAHEVVWDLFCGVGPFTILCALKQPVHIYANDINPEAITLLKRNLDQYKDKLLGKVFSFNQDTKTLVFQLPPPDRILMNLPEQAISFFPFVLQRLQELKTQTIFRPVILYLHHFGHKTHTDTTDLTKNVELMDTIRQLYEQIKAVQMKVVFCTPRVLRVVSPSKTHFVIDIKLDI